MNILLVGSGAREHAIARAIKKSKTETNLFCFGSSRNPGIIELVCHSNDEGEISVRHDNNTLNQRSLVGASLARDDSNAYRVGKLDDVTSILQFAKKNKIDWAIIGPELPLSVGLVDELKAISIPCIGPTKQLAQIETSKAFARDLLSYHGVPGLPQYKRFDFFEALEVIQEYIHSLDDNYVVKADGLMGGKGVKVYGEQLQSFEDTLQFILEIKAANSPFVIEEKFVGQEFSLISFCDGVHLAHMPAVQDHKRAYVGDTGPNTGGMGSYSDSNHSLPFLTEKDIAQAQKINELTAAALLKQFGVPYKGILYGGFMTTAEGVKLIEYNARFGDPESINVLALLETDLVEICQAITSGALDTIEIKWKNVATVCKYVVPEGYPDNPVKNQVVDVSEVKDADSLYFAAIDEREGKLYETGSRAIAVLGVGTTITEAEQKAEEEIKQIKGSLFHREDIGTEELIEKRVQIMSQIRNERNPRLGGVGVGESAEL